MINQKRFLLAVTMVTACSLAAAAPMHELDDLIAKNIQARGGIAALHAMHSLTIRGKLLINDGQIELGLVQAVERPSKIRVEASIQGLTQVQAYNGTIGWQINPLRRRRHAGL